MKTVEHKGNNVYFLQFIFLYGNESVIKGHRIGDSPYYRIPNVISFRKIEHPMEDKKYGLYRLELYNNGYIEIALDSSEITEHNKLTQVADIDNQISDSEQLLTTDVIQNVTVNQCIMDRLAHEVKYRVENGVTTPIHNPQQPVGKLYDITVDYDAS